MKKRFAISALVMGTMLLAAVPACAATLTTGDGVLSIEAPTDQWTEVKDANHWFTITDGKDIITVEHLRNGEKLPEVKVANDDYAAVYHAFVSTKNEVFVVEGLAATEADLSVLMDAIGTVKVLKPGTKTAVEKESEAAKADEFTISAINATYYVITDELNVRNGCSTDDAVVGKLYYGNEVTVNGLVQRGGADYGWYQIQFNGAPAYVSTSFLSDTKPAEKQAQTETEAKRAVGEAFSVWRADGTYVGEMVANSDGHFYINEVPFDSNGDGSYFGGAGAGMTVYDYYAYQRISGQESEERVQCEYCGEWFNAGNDYRNHVMAAHNGGSDAAATQHGLESQGSGRPVTITFEGGAWFDENNVEYYDQNDGTFVDANGDVFNVVW